MSVVWKYGPLKVDDVTEVIIREGSSVLISPRG